MLFIRWDQLVFDLKNLLQTLWNTICIHRQMLGKMPKNIYQTNDSQHFCRNGVVKLLSCVFFFPSATEE
jgi:hypothetical protein